MDNVTHTLVGAALAEAGLKRRTALGAATLMIAANFPDIDVIAVPLGNGIGWRRGITHGIAAQLILPFVLAALMLAWDRLVRLRRNPGLEPADFRQLTLLSAIGIITHPALDYMNSYGMRWLMPFVDKWFYADGLFIIDLWLLFALIACVVLSRRRRSVVPARLTLAGIAAYIVLNLGITELGRRSVASEFPARRAMVAPVAVAAWKREVVVEEPDSYRLGSYSPFSGLEMSGEPLARNHTSSAARHVQGLPSTRDFLNWARFPFYRETVEGGGRRMVIQDARYGRAGWASMSVALP